MSGDLLNERH